MECTDPQFMERNQSFLAISIRCQIGFNVKIGKVRGYPNLPEWMCMVHTWDKFSFQGN